MRARFRASEEIVSRPTRCILHLAIFFFFRFLSRFVRLLVSNKRFWGLASYNGDTSFNICEYRLYSSFCRKTLLHWTSSFLLFSYLVLPIWDNAQSWIMAILDRNYLFSSRYKDIHHHSLSSQESTWHRRNYEHIWPTISLHHFSFYRLSWSIAFWTNCSHTIS
jgi:hypothetical protein